MPVTAETSIAQIEELVRGVEAIVDSAARQTALSLLQAILALHGDALEKLMDVVFESGEQGRATIRRFASDPLISSVLVLHGLHPDDIETRVQQALGKMSSVELVGVFDGIVRVRIASTGCGGGEAVAAALWAAVPDAADILIEETPAVQGFVPLSAIASPLASEVR